MALSFLDTNIFLRHLLQDHPDHSPRATACLEKIERGELKIRTFKQPRTQIRENVLLLLGLPGIVLSGKSRFWKVFDYYVNLNISFADAYHIVFMERLRLEEIITFDQGFDRAATIRRVEP